MSDNVAHSDWFAWPATQAVFTALNHNGFEARAVGGAVRNALMQRSTNDVDFAFTGLPQDTLRLAEKAGLKTVPTGIGHGTVTLIVNGISFEVTSLRSDVKTDGRYAVVQFGGDWESDAKRRDFTMNALYADANGDVYDPLGGMDDLKAGRVRFIGEARQRIREDYLRILRFFRFSATYAAGCFDAEGVSACIAERLGVLRLSAERIRKELLQILIADRAGDAIDALDESGIFSLISGGVSYRSRFRELVFIERAEKLALNPVLRLAALAVEIEEDADRLTARLRLSSAERLELLSYSATSLKALHWKSPTTLRQILYHEGPDIFRGRVLLRWARDSFASGHSWQQALAMTTEWHRPKLPLNGKDLIAAGIKPGPSLGKILKALENAWIENNFKATREELLAIAKTLA